MKDLLLEKEREGGGFPVPEAQKESRQLDCRLEKWADRYFTKFHMRKCKVLHLAEITPCSSTCWSVTG